MVLKCLLAISCSTFAFADLRMASQPKKSGRARFSSFGGGSPMYQLANQGTVPWALGKYMHYKYMEPSHFGYAGLKGQKSRNYDNFLRSNIDNEQDNRNFNTEDGKDHLPFRSYEGRTYPEIMRTYTSFGRNRIKQMDVVDLSKAVPPGGSMMVPFRWNNPHASEMEVNIWIFNHGHKSKHPIVVPIRKPSCSGEGHQDNAIMFTVPKDFGQLGSKIPGFTGCNPDTKPPCTLQIYSHSVESRQYAMGFPIFIAGHNSSANTAKSFDGIEKYRQDPYLNIMHMRELCLPATDPSAHIQKSVPRWGRLVSDVYTHAYMNSDYSPYSGQQHESISRNMQASAINKMVTGNRGELGASILPSQLKSRLASLRKLEDKVYKNYETLANKIINRLGNNMKSQGVVGIQRLANCFRCAHAGSTNTARQQTNTYIPSYQLPKNLIQTARGLIPQKYQGLITDKGVVQVYVASTKDLLPFFFNSRHLGVVYQPAMLKGTMLTKPDAAKFKKRNAQNVGDGGKYASYEAYKKLVAERGCPASCLHLHPTFPSLLEEDAVISDDTSNATWFCVVRGDKKAVSGPFASLAPAKAELNKAKGSKTNRQMICEMSANGAKQDPRQVGGEAQGQGPKAGFNTFWDNWDAIKGMNALCTQNAKCKAGKTGGGGGKQSTTAAPGGGKQSTTAAPKQKTTVAPSKPARNKDRWWCVARYKTTGSFRPRTTQAILGPFQDVQAARTELNKQRAVRAPPSRRRFSMSRGGSGQMICEMSRNGAKADPRQVGGLNQGGGTAAGFQSSWSGPSDVGKMNGMCSNHMGCKYNILQDEMAMPLIIGSKGTNTSGPCRACLQFFGKAVPKGAASTASAASAMKKPKVTKLAKEVLAAEASGKSAADSMDGVGGTLAPNPSGTEEDEKSLLQATQARRRRRQRGMAVNKKSKKKRNGSKHKMISEFLERADLLQDHEALSLTALDDVIRLPDDNCNKTFF